MLVANDDVNAGQMGGTVQRSKNLASVQPQFITAPATPRLLWKEQRDQKALDEFSLTEKRGLLFRPVPATPKLPFIPLPPDEESPSELRETDALLPGVLSLAQAVTLPLPALSRSPVKQTAIARPPAPTIPLALQVQTTIRIPVSALSSVSRRTRKRAILLSSLLATGVILVYLVAPLILTLIPVLPENWGRALIAFQLLLLAEIIIFRILYRTTRRDSRRKAEGR